MVDIFISYAAHDRPAAQKVAQALEAYGWSVWWDRLIIAGQPWGEVINKALDDAKCVLVLWSSSANSSDWVQDEAAEGRRRRILIPVRIEDVVPPLGFRSIHAGDLLHWEGTPTAPEFRQVVSGISGLLGPPPAEPYVASTSGTTLKPPLIEPSVSSRERCAEYERAEQEVSGVPKEAQSGKQTPDTQNISSDSTIHDHQHGGRNGGQATLTLYNVEVKPYPGTGPIDVSSMGKGFFMVTFIMFSIASLVSCLFGG
jgi:hypothetical protein